MGRLKIILHSDLCSGSGQSKGSRIFGDICTDSYGLPYIPARRIKGCLRAAAYELKRIGYPAAEKEGNIAALFGRRDSIGKVFIQDAEMLGAGSVHAWIDENRTGGEDFIKEAIHPKRVSDIFTYARGQISVNNSKSHKQALRVLRVLKHYDPMYETGHRNMEFYAPVIFEADGELKDLFIACCKALRHMGTERNRGLGNVSVEYDESDNNISEKYKAGITFDNTKRYLVEYKLALESPLSLQVSGGVSTSVPASSIIGLMAVNYLKGHSKDEVFDRLFLTGETIWSNLTPAIEGKKSYPVPMMVVKLKNDGGRLINRFDKDKGADWQKYKPKTIESGFMINSGHESVIADVAVKTTSHISKVYLERYIQSFVDKGYIYAATVEVPGDIAGEAINLLHADNIRFGRSKTAEYSSCKLIDCEISVREVPEKVRTKPESPIYLVAKTDIALPLAERICPSEKEIRFKLSESLGFIDKIAEGKMDICGFESIGGFNAQWQLHKPNIQVIKAGSVFCFTAGKDSYPAEIRIGTNRQEDFGRCEIITEEMMKGLVKFREGIVDRYSQYSEKDAERVNLFRDTVVSDLCVEMVEENAFRIADTIRNLRGETVDGTLKKRKGVPIGRLRLLLTEADSYPNLRKRIDDIKDSDVDSKNVGRRYECHELLNMIYGDDYKQISAEKMLGEDISRIPEELLNDSVRERLFLNWKKPLDIVLRAGHYMGRGQYE